MTANDPRTPLGRLPRRTVISSLLSLLLLATGCGGPGADLSQEPSQILVIGIEAMGWDRVDALVAAGEMPHLAALMRDGVRAKALAPDPLESHPLWATALTGKGLAKHGMAGGLVRLPSGLFSMAPNAMRRTQHLFQIAGSAEGGGLVAAVAFPGTWPAELVNGFLVADGFAPNRWTSGSEHSFVREPGLMATAPPNLWDEIEGKILDVDSMAREDASRFFTLNETEFSMLYDEPMGSLLRHENPLREFGVTHQADLSSVEVGLHLMSTYRPKLAGVYLAMPAALQPVYWPFMFPDLYRTPSDSQRRFRDTVDESYRWIDEQIGRLVEAMPENGTVIVVSDHGYTNGEDPAAMGEDRRLVPVPSNEAVFVMSGHGVRAGVDLGQTDLADLTPTVLALMGVDVAADMDGRVLREGLEPEFLTAHPVGVIDSHDDEWDPNLRYPRWPDAEGSDSPTSQIETPESGR